MKKKKKILIMGLPGAGKTFLAKKLHTELNAIWINADQVRKDFNDWDFNKEELAGQKNENLTENLLENQYVVVDLYVLHQKIEDLVQIL